MTDAATASDEAIPERSTAINEKWVIIGGIVSLPLVNLAFVSDNVITWILTIVGLLVLGLASTRLTLRPATGSIRYSNAKWRVVGAAVSLPLALFVFATISAGSTQEPDQALENFFTDIIPTEELSDQEAEELEIFLDTMSEAMSGMISDLTLDAPLLAAKILWIIALITVLGLAVVSMIDVSKMDLLKASKQSREATSS